LVVKLLTVAELPIPEVKVIRYGRFPDERGYFTEVFRRSDLQKHALTAFLKGFEFVQSNESLSRKGTVRGLHFQWNPPQGKLVRTVHGHMVDLALDIRRGSPTFGKIVAYDMPARPGRESDVWIWVPPGFAHGTLILEDTLIEYLCTGEYSPGCEAAVSPLAPDIDWSLCDPRLHGLFNEIAPATTLMTDKDRNGLTVQGWKEDARAGYFPYPGKPG
jgi:dTDP-4-dehydrorhamnose 3,5-epimerase